MKQLNIDTRHEHLGVPLLARVHQYVTLGDRSPSSVHGWDTAYSWQIMSKRSREVSFSPSGSDSEADEEVESVSRLKFNALAPTEEHGTCPMMHCSLPPHRQALDFSSIEEFETHYAKEHSNRCSACDKNFPSAHFLSLHIDEKHNPLRAELESKGEKTYSCFVEDCEKKCSTPQKRRLHLIDKHLFPKSYNFRVVDSGIDKRRSMLVESRSQRRRVSTSSAPADQITRQRRASQQHIESAVKAEGRPQRAAKQRSPATATSSAPMTSIPQATDESLEHLTQSMSALQFVPSSVRRQQTKAGS